jgi:hypothetical protein
MRIDWHPPHPRRGWVGRWDTFVGPGATAAEEWLQLLGGLALAVLVGLCAILRFPVAPSPGQLAVTILLALDLSGGIVTNATAPAKRWYHRDGQRLRHHLTFVLPHGVHLALTAWLFQGTPWWWFPLFYGHLIGATLAILAVPLYLQRPIAFLCYAWVLVLSIIVGSPLGLEWLVPLLFLKLLLSHLLKEAPFRPTEEHRS